ncbi:MAG: prephenate dehydrogenase/arogenate dehydrogenase family protein, partial [Oscillospiraceae bacterium]|nr:prephenate dehydrogenase/arogenate dehydrogenase family protein [Oscillospiraceae bacterium]
HIAAAALCLDMPEGLTRAYMGGAYRDGTRVADIDAGLWSSLLLENRENVLRETRRLQDSLKTFQRALETGDEPFLTTLLAQAGHNKQNL